MIGRWCFTEWVVVVCIFRKYTNWRLAPEENPKSVIWKFISSGEKMKIMPGGEGHKSWICSFQLVVKTHNLCRLCGPSTVERIMKECTHFQLVIWGRGRWRLRAMALVVSRAFMTSFQGLACIFTGVRRYPLSQLKKIQESRQRQSNVGVSRYITCLHPSLPFTSKGSAKKRLGGITCSANNTTQITVDGKDKQKVQVTPPLYDYILSHTNEPDVSFWRLCSISQHALCQFFRT